MVSSLFRDKKIAAVATLVYAVFSGPAWLYSIYLRDFISSPQTWTGILYATGDKFLIQGWYPPFVVGFKHSVISLAALWWMVYAVRRLNLRNRFNFFLMSSIWALGYLFHVIDGLAFFVFLGVLLIIYMVSHDTEGKKRIRLAAIAVLIALAFVIVIELSLTNYYLTYPSFYAPSRRYYYLISPSFYLAAVASASVIILSYARMPNSMHNIFVSKYQGLKSKLPSWVNESLGVEVIFYVYFTSLILWIALFEGFHTAQFTVGQVPWYAQPVVLGVPFLLGLVGTSILLLRWRKLGKEVKNALIFCVLSSAFFFIVGSVITVLNMYFFYTGGGERGIMSWYTRAMVSILATYALFEIFRGIIPRKSLKLRHVTKVAISTLLIPLIVISSISSTLIAQDFLSSFYEVKISEEERQALTYLHYSLPRGYIAYLAKPSGISYIRAFANDKWWDDPGLWLGAEWQFGGVRAPENILFTMKQTNAAYIYVHHTRDSQVLQKSLLLQLFLSVLPVAFDNSEVSIYSVPPSIRAPTSGESELGIVKPSQSSEPAYDAYVLSLFSIALNGDVTYTILNGISDPRMETVSKTILVPYDPVPNEENASTLLDWVSHGRNLVVFNTNSFGTFEGWTGSRQKRILVSCDSDSGWSGWGERGSISIETTKKTEGNASLRFYFENLMSYQWSGWAYNVTQPEGKPWNLSEWDTIGIWIYNSITSGPQWYLKLYDVNGKIGQFGNSQFLSRWYQAKYVPSFYGWKLITIPIRKYFGELDLANVTKLEISTGYQLPVDILVDEIAVYRNITGSTYVANKIIGSQTIDLPSIAVPSLDIGGTTGVIANYTLNELPVAPFAIEKDLGSGKVSFVNILPLNNFILSDARKFDVPDTLEKIYQILQIIPKQ